MGGKSPCCGKRDPKDKAGVVTDKAKLTDKGKPGQQQTKAGGKTPGAPPAGASGKKMEAVRNSIEKLMKDGKNSLKIKFALICNLCLIRRYTRDLIRHNTNAQLLRLR